MDALKTQIAELSQKEQDALMLYILEKRSGKKRSSKKDDSEEKPKRELSDGQKKWLALVSLVRETVKSELSLEKSPQKPVLAVAGRFKEADNYEPSSDEIVASYKEYEASPWESKSAKAKSAKSGSEGSAESDEEEKPKKAAPKKDEAKEAKAAEKVKAAAEKVKAAKKAAPKKAAVVESDSESEDEE